MREYVTPNWHVVLVHAPLGLLSVGIFIELFSFLWRRSPVRSAGRWMILLGALTAVPALTSGLYAYRDALSPVMKVDDVGFGDKWSSILDGKLVDRASVVPGEKAKEISVDEYVHNSGAGTALWNHLLYNSIGVGVLFLVIITFIGASDRWRRNLYLPLLVLLLLGEAIVIRGSHEGGLAVYEHAAAIKPPTAPSTMVPTMAEKIKAVLPPAQLHFTLAGWVVGVALIALALSIRAITEGAPTPGDEAWFEGQNPDGTPAGTTPTVVTSPSDSLMGTDNAAVAPTLSTAPPLQTQLGYQAPAVSRTVTTSVTTTVEPLVPVATSRFWLLSTLITILTAVSGLWIINAWTWDYLKHTLQGENRNMYHSVLGASVIVLTLLLAIVTRIARRSKLAISIFALLLFLALGLQVYVGVMLTFDGPKYVVPKGSSANLITPFKLNVVKD